MFSLTSLIILLKITSIVRCDTCRGHCQHFKFVIDQDVVQDSALEGHVIRRITVKSAAQCHMECRDECLCVSINYLQNTVEVNCELNEVNKEMIKPAALKHKPGSRYYDLVRSYTVEVRNNIKKTKNDHSHFFLDFSNKCLKENLLVCKWLNHRHVSEE